MPFPKPLLDVLLEPARPVFLFGSTPPREGTTEEKAIETCRKFANRSGVLATDGFIVYDIQDEGARTNTERPFPFRKTMDPAIYASYFPTHSGKQCIVYKCVTEESTELFDNWLERASTQYRHHCFNLVGAASSTERPGVSLSTAAARTKVRDGVAFGCVCIPERHITKGNENQNMINKVEYGAQWFITQGIFDAGPIIKLLNDYGDLCRTKNIIPKKVILTFAPCGRPKTMTFIRWLGMQVPEEVEQRIFASANPVQESTLILNEILSRILAHTHNSCVPIGLNVESLSIFKEEINAAHDLFQSLQANLLKHAGSPWAVRWFYVDPTAFSSSRSSSHSSTPGIQLNGSHLIESDAADTIPTNGKKQSLEISLTTSPTSPPATANADLAPTEVSPRSQSLLDNSWITSGSALVATGIVFYLLGVSVGRNLRLN